MHMCDGSQLSVRCSSTLLSLLQTTDDDQVVYGVFYYSSFLQHSIQQHSGEG